MFLDKLPEILVSVHLLLLIKMLILLQDSLRQGGSDQGFISFEELNSATNTLLAVVRQLMNALLGVQHHPSMTNHCLIAPHKI